MDVVLADSHLDDVIVFGCTFQENLLHLYDVLSKLCQVHLKVKPSKCNLFVSQVQYLGQMSAERVMADPAMVETAFLRTRLK